MVSNSIVSHDMTKKPVVDDNVDDDDDRNNATPLPPCFRLPIISLLVPYFVGMLAGETKKQSQKELMTGGKTTDVFQAVDDDDDDEIEDNDEEEIQQDDDELLRNMALEVSKGDLGYSPPHQVSVGGNSDQQSCGLDEVLSCSTTAEDDDDNSSSSCSPAQEETMLHRCGICNFRISLHWRFCPECGMYIEASTVRTLPLNTLNLSYLEGADVDTPKRDESYVDDLIDGLE
jgi:hypothetical protein